jgi:hypothetical protein
MTSRIIVNNIQSDTGISTITISSPIALSGGVTGGGFAVGTGASISSPATNVLTVSTNNVERVRISAAGRFGFNTISPQSLIDIGAGSASAPTYKGTIRIQPNDAQAINSNGGIEFLSSTYSNGYGYRISNPDLTAGQTPLIIESRSDSITWTERVRIDSSGRVTMPYQPGFKISVGNRTATGSGRILSTDAGDTFSSNRDCFNTGNHFTTSNGRFTAPVAGRYMFIFSFMRNVANGSDINVRFQKNTASGESQTMYGRIFAGAYTSNYQQSIGVTITQLSVNDYVNLFIGANTSIYDDDTFFAGHLLG